MAEIYPCASLVYTWVGPNSPETEKSLGYIKKMSRGDGSSHMRRHVINVTYAEGHNLSQKRKDLWMVVIKFVMWRWMYYPDAMPAFGKNIEIILSSMALTSQ
jgi:hypothetical protein